MDFITFESNIGYSFKDKSLLKTALTHRSYAFEHSSLNVRPDTNERLEFLGDAVLELISSDLLYHLFLNHDEGRLSKIRASLVCEAALSDRARDIGLGEYVLLGKGEERSGGRERPSILSDALEAVIGAIYLDGGFLRASDFVREYVLVHPEKADINKASFDSKSSLQEWAQARGKRVSYRIISEAGPDHNKKFDVEVLIDDVYLAKGSGSSKKHAEQQAAANAINILDS